MTSRGTPDLSPDLMRQLQEQGLDIDTGTHGTASTQGDTEEEPSEQPPTEASPDDMDDVYCAPCTTPTPTDPTSRNSVKSIGMNGSANSADSDQLRTSEARDQPAPLPSAMRRGSAQAGAGGQPMVANRRGSAGAAGQPMVDFSLGYGDMSEQNAPTSDRRRRVSINQGDIDHSRRRRSSAAMQDHSRRGSITSQYGHGVQRRRSTIGASGVQGGSPHGKGYHPDCPIHGQPKTGMRDPLVPCWTWFTQRLLQFFSDVVTFFALHAVKYPKIYLIVITIVSFTLVLTGFFTGFRLELNLDAIFTPIGSRPEVHALWINTEGFPDETRHVQIIFHAHGHNVLHAPQARRVMQAVEVIRNTPGYDALCSQGTYLDFTTNLPTCRIISPSAFWQDHSLAAFDESVLVGGDDSDEDAALRAIVSQKEFNNTVPVVHDLIMGNYLREGPYSSNVSDPVPLLTTAQSYMVQIYLPNIEDETDTFEADMLSNLADLRKDWIEEDAAKEYGDRTYITIDIMTVYAYQLELLRAIVGDLWLVPISLILMVGATCLIFYKHGDRVQSRAMLGLASVTTICMSVFTGFGICFLANIPYTAIHQVLPFVIFGIGLDDTFIITGAYFRTDPKEAIEDRIQITMQEVGPSITLTTVTTIFAFTLGRLTSSLPGVHYLCMYAVTVIIFIYFYQITYFVAFLVLDENRIQQNRRDCCFWQIDEEIDTDEEDTEDEEQDNTTTPATVGGRGRRMSDISARSSRAGGGLDYSTRSAVGIVHHDLKCPGCSSLFQDCSTHFAVGGGGMDSESEEVSESSAQVEEEIIRAVRARASIQVAEAATTEEPRKPGLPLRAMQWYSEFLMKPVVKVLVLIIFTAFFGLNCYSAMLMEQHFNVADYVAKDSYLQGVFASLDKYASVTRPMVVYFRDIDQMDPAIQQQMVTFVNEVEDLPQLGGVSNLTIADMATTDQLRPFCWVRDVQEIFAEAEAQYGETFTRLTFNERLDILLTSKAYEAKLFREVYGQDIIRDEHGNITASRCYLFLKDLNFESVTEQINMLHDQRAVSARQPINQQPEHSEDWAMFNFETMFFYWEMYDVAVDELLWTIISGVIAVTVIATVFIPHWTAPFFVLPIIIVLYIDMLGTIRFLGLNINALTYICIVVAVGLLVDFLMHVLLRYYESRPDQSREERVKETLQTMGVSILVGGGTTFLGVVPLCLSALTIFMTVFYSFFAMVFLGLTHGLILMPVVLSLIGPKMAVRGHHLAPKPDFPVSDPKVVPVKRRKSSVAGTSAATSRMSSMSQSRRAESPPPPLSTMPMTIPEDKSFEMNGLMYSIENEVEC